MNLSSNFVRRLCRSIGLVAVLVISSTPAPAKTDPRLASGLVNTNGTVAIDGQKALDGRTIFERASVVTSEHSESLITLSNSARLNLAAETNLSVEFAETRLSGSLASGRVTVFVPASVRLNFQTTDISITNDAAGPVVFTIEARECEDTRVSVASGQLIARKGGGAHTVKAGETLPNAPADSSPPQHLSGKKKAGVFATIGGVVAIMLAVALGQNDDDQENPGDFGGQVTAPSPR